ncbi:MAG: hypothetical protein WD824_26595 [Cyclobacteriaceae bacterium]
MSQIRIFFLLFFFLKMFQAHAQSNYAPLNEDYYHWVDRYEIKTGQIVPEIFTAIKPYKRSAIIGYIDSLKESGVFSSSEDLFNYEYLSNDNWEWSGSTTNESQRPLLRHFYKKKSDFYSVSTRDFDLHVNPVTYLGVGKDSRRDDMLFINTRGVEVRGMVDKKVGFYTYLTDNQALLPSYVADQMSATGVVPHEGFWKEYKEGEGVDFLQARGYITFEATKSINVQFGHDRFFIGNGYRSLIFSDFSPPSLFLKGNVKVWKLNYLFLLNQMTADNRAVSGGVSRSYPNKFVALHHLSINIGKKLNVGIFESVIFSPDDSVGTDHFRLEYLNPIIFYRAIEQQNGSSDNVLLGLDFKWNAVRQLSFYGQFMLDEFVIDNIREGNGWWANKFGVQVGGKYVDAFGLQNLDLQGEINLIRPYTYSHHTAYGSYSSYRQPIAHPLGANLKEMVGILRYQPLPRLNLTGKLVFTTVGRDTTGVNWGGDILKSYRTREQEYNNTVAQGVSNDILFGSFTASWQLKHNVFIDAAIILRKSKSAVAFYDNNTSITSLALRWNIPQRLYEF